MQPKPQLESKCTPPQVTPAPLPEAPSRGTALKKSLGGKPFHAQVAALVPDHDYAATPAILGQRAGTALAEAQAANAAARANAKVTYNFGDRLGQAQSAQGDGAQKVSDYLPDLIRHGKAPGHEGYIVEAQADIGAYRGAQAATSVVSPLWTSAFAIGDSADVHYEASMDALERGGLAGKGEAKAPVDEQAVAAESAIYSDGAASSGKMGKAPKTDGGGVQDAMTGMLSAGFLANTAVIGQRVLLTQAKGDAAQSEADDFGGKVGLLGDIVSFVTSARGFLTGIGLASGFELAKATMSLVGDLVGPSELQSRIEACKKIAQSDRELAGWQALAGAITALGEAQARLVAAMQTLQDETQEATRGLQNGGVEVDRGEPTKAAAAPDESRGAMGLHLGKLLEAQRFTSAARDGWSSVRGPIGQASGAAERACANPSANTYLANVKRDMNPPARFLGTLRGVQAAQQAKYAQRLEVLAPSIKTVVSDLGSLSENV